MNNLFQKMKLENIEGKSNFVVYGHQLPDKKLMIVLMS